MDCITPCKAGQFTPEMEKTSLATEYHVNSVVGRVGGGDEECENQLAAQNVCT